MKLQDQVCSLELSKQLKNLGFKQESLFWWFESNDKNDTLLCFDAKLPNEYSYDFEKSCSAYTSAELGEMLPLSVDGFCLQIWREKGNESWDIAYNTDSGNLKIMPWEQSNTEADARAKCLIYLKTNNLL